MSVNLFVHRLQNKIVIIYSFETKTKIKLLTIHGVLFYIFFLRIINHKPAMP